MAKQLCMRILLLVRQVRRSDKWKITKPQLNDIEDKIVDCEKLILMLRMKLGTCYERYKDFLKDLTIMSDVFMRNVFKKRECTEYVLQVIMNKKDLKVIDQVLQKDYKNLQGVQLFWTVLPEILKASRWM